MELLLLLIPTFFQIIVGGKSKTKSIELAFEKVCLISYLSQIVLCVVLFFYLSNTSRVCGAVFSGLIMINILFLIVITVVVIMQNFRYKY